MAALAGLLAACPLSGALAQDQPPSQGTSRGENFSAKPPAQLFASDCTGAGCHKGPQGLGRGQFSGSLAGFLREHYTNSRESAAALAGYLSNIPRGAAATPEPRTPRAGKPAATATAPTSALPNWGEGAESKPAPGEVRPPRPIPGGRSSRAAARPDEDPAATPPAPPVAAPPAAESHPARAPRGRQPAATAAVPAPAVAPVLPPPPPEPEAAPAAPPAPPPAANQFDIFD